ncbi:hypothetical protein Pmar_PMAR011987 [Perkinsus marinus ATCC 50983]|uniref:Uncharacterized protein n=1 Tax=Perkinsus marinus (strain ATCC 50983 / TXsc) TaxID=423536 RepID=C5LBV8_PERM5|nr:hypothetical protein Pmar_PMAR011987 [Perkinsus marinus ATCC 50983]EER05929.1 hypothetical protein Pmar_PMAR011987 [Perkinsus marinus ATCC 50983]|eukprot:XP_002774113.1 hypothetical protein Pmar_PMAR011987 [Perkinsus marinus ATCC 50983]
MLMGLEGSLREDAPEQLCYGVLCSLLRIIVSHNFAHIISVASKLIIKLPSALAQGHSVLRGRHLLCNYSIRLCSRRLLRALYYRMVEMSHSCPLHQYTPSVFIAQYCYYYCSVVTRLSLLFSCHHHHSVPSAIF